MNCTLDVAVLLLLRLFDERFGCCLTSEPLVIDHTTCVSDCAANSMPVDGRCQPCDGQCPKGFMHISVMF